MGAPAYHVGATVVNDTFTYGEASGHIRSVVAREPPKEDRRAPPVKPGPTWPIGTITPTTTPARYAGRLLVGSADYKLHAVGDNGMHLWSYQTGGRVYSSPVPDGDEVYFGSDDGRLYKVDIDSGILIWEFATGDKVRSAPALADGRVFVASWDGFLYAIEAGTGLPAWKAPIAKYTRSSPAVQSGRVYIGDEEGHMLCFDAGSGKLLWSRDLGGYISMCPVVADAARRGRRDRSLAEPAKPATRSAARHDSESERPSDGGVFFASEQGQASLVRHDGTVRWKRDLGARVTGQPFATRTQLLVPTERGPRVLRRADGQTDARFVPPPEDPGQIISLVPYRGKLFMLAAYAQSDARYPPRTYVVYNGAPIVWAPRPKPTAPSAKGAR
jgi:outer membrane protein assembly factor BamB